MMLTNMEGPDAAGNKTYTFESQYSIEVPQRYDVRSVIGRGAYGLVCSAVDTSRGGEPVAIKKISRLFEDRVDAKRVLREIKLLAFLDHPNILSLHDLFIPRDRAGFSDLYVVTELMEEDLHALLRSPTARLSIGHCQYFTLQLLRALRHLHSSRVVHRDLKPGNLLTNSDCELKLCDFGLARGLSDAAMTNYVVTRWYRPPELLLVSSSYDEKVDMWSAGCLAAETISGRTLFAGNNYIHQINLIVDVLGKPAREQLPPAASAEAVKYISSLPDAKPRPLAAACPELARRFGDRSFYDSFEDEAGGGGGGPAAAPSEEQQRAHYATFEAFLMRFLRYRPDQRCSAAEAMEDAWLADAMWDGRGTGDADAEMCRRRPFVWARDDEELTVPQLRELFLEEVDAFQARKAARADPFGKK